MIDTHFSPLAGPYRRRTRWQRVKRFGRDLVRFLLSSHP